MPTQQSSAGPSKHPDAMDIDASRQEASNKKEKHTRGTYIKWMQGKCYGCGSKEHNKKDGNHERDVCNHCGKTGHRTPVCFTKYLGKAGQQSRANATAEEAETPPKSKPSASASASNSSPAKDNKYADLLAQLQATITKQGKELEALKASF
jgi:hypothetical protein